MGGMFSSAGYNVTTFSIIGLSNLNTARVEDMKAAKVAAEAEAAAKAAEEAAIAKAAEEEKAMANTRLLEEIRDLLKNK